MLKEKYAVAFTPQITWGNEAVDTARSLTEMIGKWAAEGWDFSHLENVTVIRNNGCIASLFGNPTTLLTFQVAILVRDPRETPPAMPAVPVPPRPAR